MKGLLVSLGVCVSLILLGFLLWKQEKKITEITLEDIRQFNEGEMPEYETKEDGTLHWIAGCFSEKRITSSAEAIEALSEMEALLGVGDVKKELQETSVIEDDTGIICQFEQVYEEIPVYGSIVSLWANADGKASFLRTDCTKMPGDFICEPKISMQEAQNGFLTAYPESRIDEMAYQIQNEEEKLYLCIYDAGEDGIFLGWRIYAMIDEEEWEAIIDASNGAVLHMRKTSCSAIEQKLEVTGRDLMGKWRGFGITKNKSGIYELQDKTRKIVVYDSNENIITSKSKNTWDMTSVSAMANLRSVYDYYVDTVQCYSYNCASFLLGAHTLKAMLSTEIKDNAYWSGNKSMILIGTGSSDGKFYPKSFAAAKDIIAHEFTHGVISQKTSLEYAYCGAAGAVNEGYADLFGCLVQADWKIGEDITRKKSLRDIAIPFNTGNPSKVGGAYYIDYKTNTIDNGGIHTNSTIISHIGYELYKNGMSRKDIARLWYRSLCLGYGKYTDFYDVRINVLTAASSLQFSNNQITMIKNAFDEANIKKENCQEIDHSYMQLYDLRIQNQPPNLPVLELVLQWNKKENDLDLAVTGVMNNGGEFQISYENFEFRNEHGELIANLIIDDTKGPGVETIQIWDDSVKIKECKVSLYGGGIIEQATVMLYEKGSKLNSYLLEESVQNTWYVFS